MYVYLINQLSKDIKDTFRDKIRLWRTVAMCRPVVPGFAGCAMAHPDFARSVNPISTRGDRLCPPN